MICVNHADIIKNGVSGYAGFAPRIKGLIMLLVTMAGLFYHFILPKEEGFIGLDNILVHYAVPVFCIADWLVFDKKKSFRWYDPVLWMTAPFVYLCYIFIRAEIFAPFPSGSRYPYFFLDTDVMKKSAVIFYAAVIGAVFVLAGELFYFLDRFLPQLFGSASAQGED